MVKDRIKKLFTSRIFYVAFSLLAAVSIWLYISYIENPDISQTVRVNVRMMNEEYLTDRGLVVTSINPEAVTLRFTGKRNIVTRLKDTNVTATVDLSMINEKSVRTLTYDVSTPLDISLSSFTLSKSVDNITVIVDNLVAKEIQVKGSYTGGVAEGYQMDPMELSPEVITVSGPQDVVSNISYALVTLQRENISKTVVEQRPFTLIDDNGHEVVSDKLTFSQDTVNVEIPVNMVKEIPLKVDLKYGAGANSANTSYAISPSTISLSGDAEILNEINHLPIGTIDTTKFLNGKELVFPIVLPNETKNLTGVTEATITVTISGLESTHVTTSNIAVTNETAGYSAEIITKSIDLLLRGTPKDIEKITPDEKGDTDVPVSYRVVADLSDLGDTEGTYSVLAKVYVDGDVDVGAVGDYMVTVRISRD